MIATQLKYDLLMFSRELFYVVFTLIVPPVTYLFMGSLYGGFTYAGNLSYAESYTPSFILLITFGVVFFAFGFDQVTNRVSGVEKRIALAPVSRRTILISGILKSIIITSFGYIFVSLIGVMAYDLTFEINNALQSFGLFMLLNAVLLIISSAIYSFFKTINGALVFSIVTFQVVLFTGGFAMPIDRMPAFVQTIAAVNPLYHMNQLFISVWNGQFQLERTSLISLAYIGLCVILALFALRFATRYRSSM
ncbi:ABC-2 type transport system permease protein [Sporosarcina luteola]|nr:ABC-2 type transport system permease protein [Sporosarcina luteola]